MTSHRETYASERGDAYSALIDAAEARNRHEVADHLAEAQVRASLAQAAATADVADAIRALANAARPMGGRL